MIDEKTLIQNRPENLNDRMDDELKSANHKGWNECNSYWINIICSQPKVGDWVLCSERLPGNAKHKGAFCPKYQIMTEYGVTEGWYNPDHESWYVLFWFMYPIHEYKYIDFERGDIPKVVKVPRASKIVTAWRPLPEPWEGEKKDEE